MFQVSFAIIVILLAYTSNAFKEQTYNEKEALKNAWYSASVYCDSQFSVHLLHHVLILH
jgi:hypothetical protein